MMRGVSHSTVPPCFGEADRMGCLWREECVKVTLSRPPDRRYGPRKRRRPPDSDSGSQGTHAGK